MHEWYQSTFKLKFLVTLTDEETFDDTASGQDSNSCRSHVMLGKIKNLCIPSSYSRVNFCCGAPQTFSWITDI